MRNPFKGWRNKAEPVQEKKSTTLSIPPGSFLHYVFTGGGYVTAQQAASFYRSTSAIATAVDMIAGSIEQIKPVIETEDGKFESDSPVLDFLKSPNGFDGWHNFVGSIARNWLLKHDSLISSSGNVKFPPHEAFPVSLQEVSVVQDIDEYPGSYIVTSGPIRGNFLRDELRNEFKTRFYAGNLKEIFHIRGYSSRVTKIDSDSPLQAAANEARQIIKGKTHNLKMLENGGRLSLIISFKDETDDDEHKERVKRINEQYGGPEKTGKIGVISGQDMSVQEFGMSNKDMDYKDLELMAALAIYLRYHIPLPLVTNDSATFSNMESSIQILYDQAVLPNADIVFSGLTDFLFPRFGLDTSKSRITYNPESIGPLKKRMLDEVEQRRKINVETDNEIRSLLPNREPYEGGDIKYQPANLVPIGEDVFTSDNNDT